MLGEVTHRLVVEELDPNRLQDPQAGLVDLGDVPAGHDLQLPLATGSKRHRDVLLGVFASASREGRVREQKGCGSAWAGPLQSSQGKPLGQQELLEHLCLVAHLVPLLQPTAVLNVLDGYRALVARG